MKFKDLSLPLKIGIVGGWLAVINLIIGFIVGFFAIGIGVR